MSAALIVPRLAGNPAANLATIERLSAEAVSRGAGLILLPEAALTGLVNNDDPAHDLPLGQAIPGPATARWDADEMPQYAERVRMAGAPGLMVNYLADASLDDDRSFVGAFPVSAQGETLAQQPLGVEGVLVVDLDGGAGDGV